MKRWKDMVVVPAVVVSVLTLGARSAAGQYKQINLVSDKQGIAHRTDPSLLDPWGLAFLPHGHLLVANARSGLATAYGPHGEPMRLTIAVPAAPSLPTGAPGSPTGLISNPSSEFIISKNGRSGPARFIFDTLDGTISGWNPDVDPTAAIIVVDNSTKTPFPASYTGLAIGKNSSGQNVIYAADSGGSATTSNNQIDMYDGSFNYLGSFTDPNAPSNMTVFGIQNVNGKLYVTFAAFTPLNGGIVDVFDTDGHLLERFAASDPSGPLEEPWAVALTPNDFGQFSDALLVGNFGDGRISAFNPSTGAFLGQLADDRGNPLSSGLGLWGLAFLTDAKDEPGRLFFASGINGELDGLFGFIVPTNHDDPR